METRFRGDFYALGTSGAQEGYSFDGGEMHDVELELRGEVCEREDFFDGVGFECWRSGS